MEHYHYLGHENLPGAQLRYLLYSQEGSVLGAMGFGAAGMHAFLASTLSRAYPDPIGRSIAMAPEASLDKSFHQNGLPAVTLLKILRQSTQALPQPMPRQVRHPHPR